MVASTISVLRNQILKAKHAYYYSGDPIMSDAEYDALPEALKMLYTPREYAVIPPERRGRLLEEETMPEVGED